MIAVVDDQDTQVGLAISISVVVHPFHYNDWAEPDSTRGGMSQEQIVTDYFLDHFGLEYSHK